MNNQTVCKCPHGCACEHDKQNAPKEESHYQDPTDEMLDNPLWNAIWAEIKTWDINVPSQYAGYCGATGNHVTAIFLAINGAFSETFNNNQKWLTFLRHFAINPNI